MSFYASNNVVTASPFSGPLTDRSGTATTTTAIMMAANPVRQFLMIQTPTKNGIWVNFGTAATAASPSMFIPGNGVFMMEGSFISSDAINVINAGTTAVYTAKEG